MSPFVAAGLRYKLVVGLQDGEVSKRSALGRVSRSSTCVNSVGVTKMPSWTSVSSARGAVQFFPSPMGHKRTGSASPARSNSFRLGMFHSRYVASSLGHGEGRDWGLWWSLMLRGKFQAPEKFLLTHYRMNSGIRVRVMQQHAGVFDPGFCQTQFKKITLGIHMAACSMPELWRHARKGPLRLRHGISSLQDAATDCSRSPGS